MLKTCYVFDIIHYKQKICVLLQFIFFMMLFWRLKIEVYTIYLKPFLLGIWINALAPFAISLLDIGTTTITWKIQCFELANRTFSIYCNHFNFTSVVIAFRIVSFVITSTISLPPFKIASSLGRVQALAKLAIISLHVIAATITSIIVTFGIVVSVIAKPE